MKPRPLPVVCLDHLTVPSRDRVASARLLGDLLGVPWAAQGAIGNYSPVYVNAGLTLDFAPCEEPLPTQHYCFRVDQETFDAVVQRIRAAGLPFRGQALGLDDGQVGQAHGGQRIYWHEPDGHIWELLTVSYKRKPP